MNRRQETIIRIVSFILIIIFFILGIAAILFAQGSFIDFSDGNIISTGSIKINTQVTDFKVLINNEESTVRQGIVSGLQEGSYSIKVFKDGYNTWQGTVKVNRGLISEVDVQLFPTKFAIENLVNTKVLKYFFSPDNKYIFYFDQNKNLFRFTIQASFIPIVENTVLKIAEPNLIESLDLTKTNFEVSNDNNQILIYFLNSKEKISFATISSNNFNQEIKFSELDFKIDKLKWLNNSESFLIITKEGLYLDYDYRNNIFTYINLFKETPSLIQYKEKVYYIKDNQLFEYSNKKSTLLKIPGLTPIAITSLIKANNTRVLIKSIDDTIYFFDIENKLLQKLDYTKIVTVSPDLLNILFEEDNSLISIKLKYNTENKLLIEKTENKVSNLLANDILWSEDSTFFVYTKLQDKLQLLASDYTTQNIVNLFKSEDNTLLKSVLISKDNSFIILALEDENKDIKIYKIKLI